MPDKIDDGGPAFPWGDPVVGMRGGLTKRELFAAMAMQGFCSDPRSNESEAPSLARWSVVYADALLAALTPKDSTQ